jgi:hypothetical protein
MKTLLVSLLLALTLCACGGAGDEIAPGRYDLKMSFQGSELAGGAIVGAGGVGSWNASNAENSYAGDVVTGPNETTWWFGAANSSAFELRTIDGRSTDPAIDATIVLTPAR